MFAESGIWKNQALAAKGSLRAQVRTHAPGQFRPVGGRVQIAPERTLKHTGPPLRTDVHRLLQLPRCDRVMSAAELQRLPLRSRYSDPAMPACSTTLAQRAISELMKP